MSTDSWRNTRQNAYPAVERRIRREDPGYAAVQIRLIKLLYKPFAIIAGIISARLGKSIFRKLWAKIDHEKPPSATEAETSAGKAIGAAALEAATMAATAAAVNRASAKSFQHLVGVWPGERRSEDEDQP